MHAAECFLDHLEREGMVFNIDYKLLPEIAKFFTVQGVKVGGFYRHFKGKVYEVTGVRRNADKWDQWLVDYVQTDDTTHKASRPVEDFIGMHESGVRRFTLVL